MRWRCSTPRVRWPIESVRSARDEFEFVADDFEVDTIGELDIVSDDVDFDDETWAVAVIGCIEPLGVQRRSSWPGRDRRSADTSASASRGSWRSRSVLQRSPPSPPDGWSVDRCDRSIGCDANSRTITSADLGRRIVVPPSGDELEALGSSFNHTIDRLEHGVDSQRRFTSDAAHELRSPLAGVRAVLEVGQRQPERATDSIATAIAQVDRASRLVDDLLVLARRDGDRTPRERRPVDLDDLVAGEVREAAARHPAGRVRSTWCAARAGTGRRPLGGTRRPEPPRQRCCARPPVGASAAGSGRRRDRARPRPGWVLTVDDDGPGVPTERARTDLRALRTDRRLAQPPHRRDRSRARDRA